MPQLVAGPQVRADIERWSLRAPFRVAGFSRDFVDVLVVELRSGSACGRGEATGVRQLAESAHLMLEQLAEIRTTLERGISRTALQTLLPPGGLRNALDCALWDLESQIEGKPAWKIAGLKAPAARQTFITCGIDAPDLMAEAARLLTHAKAIKIKLAGDEDDRTRILAVRTARPDVALSIDANGSLSMRQLEELLPVCVSTNVLAIEQPFARGSDAVLKGMRSPIPLVADESVQCAADIDRLVDLYDVVNIKLDKCGGLTEGFLMHRQARNAGLKTWVGNMVGTSLAMAPAFLLSQVCDFVELDGPTVLASDRADAVSYHGGFADCPAALWGYPRARE
jgi:L-Ala-D/L-Glu epimerase